MTGHHGFDLAAEPQSFLVTTDNHLGASEEDRPGPTAYISDDATGMPCRA